MFTELEECDKILCATEPLALSYYQSWQNAVDELPESEYISTSCFAEKGAFTHRRRDMHGSCLPSVWVTVTLLRGCGGRERYKDRWREELRVMGTRPLPRGSSHLPTGEWPKRRHEHTHTCIYSNCASLAALIKADMPFILLLLEHRVDRQQVNQITGYHTVVQHILDEASVRVHRNVCTQSTLFALELLSTMTFTQF